MLGETHYDVLVVGGGIVGLSTAYAITRESPGTSVAVLEKESAPTLHQTGRNSGVIHSGIYYRPGSYKARLATQGAAEMVKFCAEHQIPHEVTGKLIVATTKDELPQLHALVQRGRENGVPVQELSATQIPEYEPQVRGVAAIHVGTTGVCDFGEVARTLLRLAEETGTARLLTGAEVRSITRRPGGGVTVQTPSAELHARVLVNCAGLYCDRVARLAGDDPGMRIMPFRGEYYELTAATSELVRGLVYPVPDPAFPFLGVHLTRDVHGRVHVGPSAVPALAREGYSWTAFRPSDLAAMLAYPGTWRLAVRHWRNEVGEMHRSLSKKAFAAAARRLLPGITKADLLPHPAGVRAQAVLRDGTLVDDFFFGGSGPVIHVLNAPSPAATAALPIGREIAGRALAAIT